MRSFSHSPILPLSQSICFLLLILFFISCAKPIPQTSKSVEPRTDLHSLSSYVEASLKARGRIEHFNAAVLLTSPSRLRIDFLDDLGQLRGRLVADGSEVLWYDAETEIYNRLSQDSKAIKKILKLPLSVEEFIEGMLLQTQGNSSFQVEAEANSSQRGILYPQTLRWHFKKPKALLTLQMRDAVLNQTIPSSRFDTTPPPGATSGKIR